MKERIVEELFRDWLQRGQSGCHFASHAASNAEFVFSTFTSDLDGHDLDAAADLVDAGADSGCVAILMFPRISGMSEFVKVIARFDHPPRWMVSGVVFRDSNANIVGVNITFRTRRGAASAAMGLRPVSRCR